MYATKLIEMEKKYFYKGICIVLSIFIAASSFSQATQDSIKRENDKKSIDSQVNRLLSDLNTHEFTNMDYYTTDDVEWVNIVGMWWKGRTDVKKAHEWGFNKFFKGVPFTRKQIEIRFLTNDVAVLNDILLLAIVLVFNRINFKSFKLFMLHQLQGIGRHCIRICYPFTVRNSTVWFYKIHPLRILEEKRVFQIDIGCEICNLV